jgi:hypothetical protein
MLRKPVDATIFMVACRASPVIGASLQFAVGLLFFQVFRFIEL